MNKENQYTVTMTEAEHENEMKHDLLPEMERQLTDKHHYDLRKQYLQACEATGCITLNGQGIRRFFADHQGFTDNIQLFVAWMLAHHKAEPEDIEFSEEGISIYGMLATKVYADLSLVAETCEATEALRSLFPLMEDGSIADKIHITKNQKAVA